MSARLMVVDDDDAMGSMLRAHLVKRGYEVDVFPAAEPAFVALRAAPFDVVITDLNMKGRGGLELCAGIASEQPDVPVIVITAFGSMETAIAAIRAGAWDFLPKPFEVPQLLVAIERAVEHRQLKTELRRLRRVVAEATGYGEMVGDSPPMRRLYELLERVRESDASVLITGESGTGKELVARALHRSGRRSDGPLVALNCASMPESLLESELFGHARGAFTDARVARQGLFLQAHRGTLFLDEVGELPLGLQPKLLRALQERRVRPLGADTEVEFDARLIAATNRNLEAAVSEGRFREDLFYRLNVLHLQLPPLRARGNDVLLLAQKFLERFANSAGKEIVGLSGPVAARMLAYPWPGNVRELSNCIERAVALAQFRELVLDDLPERVRDHKRVSWAVETDDPANLEPMEAVERRYIQRVLEAVKGSKAAAARVLGFDRTTLYRKLERYGLGADRAEE